VALLAASTILLTMEVRALPADRAVRQYVRRAWTVEQGLPHGTVRGFAQTADGSFWMRGGDGGTVALIPRPDRKKAEHTALSFEVTDIDAEIKDLERRGVKFEDYDLPDLKTVNHVFSTADEKCAWLTDPEGNILCLHQPTRPH